MANVNAHISSDEIRKDIADTEAEIESMVRLDRWEQVKAEARAKGIRERREFIDKLRAILAGREEGELRR